MSKIIEKTHAKQIWIQAQQLHRPEPFGHGAKATKAAVEHLGYVQIDTISVVERCHHHILFNRIPRYKRQDLHRAQTIDKMVFEYWTHALAYVPTKDYRFFAGQMLKVQKQPSAWFQTVTKEDWQKVLRLIKKEGAISIRDIGDDVLVEKSHLWGSAKPSKKALQLGFNNGRFVISERVGMLKKYALTEKHFGWGKAPKAASAAEILEYLLERSLRSQGLVSVDSICYLDAKSKPGIRKLLAAKEQSGELVSVKLRGAEKESLWIRPEDLERDVQPEEEITHILSPFDPLIIQRKRLKAFFDYEHRFEAYIPKEKRIFGYFALPVLLDDRIVAALDLKTDRQEGKLLIQKWNWLAKGKSASNKKRIEEELHRFEKFQLER